MIRIHYIEDNPVDQHAFIREVEKKSLPYLIDFSSSLSDAQKKDTVYDLILCDYFLPDGTILDIISDLIKDETPVIVVTGQADITNAISALKLGAKDYLIKDLDRQYLSILPTQIEILLKNRQIEVERRWMSTLLYSFAETTPFGIYLYEPETDRVIYWNAAFLTIWEIPDATRFSGDHLTHSTICHHISDRIESRFAEVPIFPTKKTNYSRYQADGEARVRENKTIRFLTSRVQYEPGPSPCFVSVFEDTSELSRARESLYQYSLELESITATLDQRVQERNLQIDLLMRKTNEMIVNIGHDLRTPLTPLIALLPFLRDHESDPEKQRLLSVLCDGATKIRSLADAALHVGCLEDGSYQDEENRDSCLCDLREAMISIITGYLPAIEKRELQVSNKTPEDIKIFINPTHLRLILDNLIHNAIQYSHRGGLIVLHGGNDSDSIWFCVSDSGIGLTPEDTSRIFDEFYKVDSARNNLQAHGLGLTVVKKLVILNSGHITVKSAGLGKGSRFSVSLPLGR